MIMFCRLLYGLTVYLPLRFRDLCISFLALFVSRELVIEIASKLLAEKSLIGVLPDENLISYPLDDFKLLSIVSEIYHKRIYDVENPETLEFVCDVGAHIGLFTLRVSKQASNSKITAIEANPRNFKFLLENISINGLKERVCGLNVAAGERKGTTTLWLNKLSRGDSSTKKWHDAWSAGHFEANILPLDTILSNQTSLDLVKIDVEGGESEVLSGLEKQYAKVGRFVIETHIPVVNIKEIYGWLRVHGFVITKTQKLYEDCILVEARRALSIIELQTGKQQLNL
jgi:FkbM family methyltransferase